MQPPAPATRPGDGWQAYVELRREALRELAVTRGLSYSASEGLFWATSPGEAGGGIWATSADVGPDLAQVLERSAPDWVALTEPAAALIPLARQHGCAVVQSASAMQLTSLAALPDLPLPPSVTVHRVDVEENPESITLEEALLVDALYGSGDAASVHRDLPLEASALRELPGVTLLTAVDAGGSCVATAGTRVVGSAALVSAVATIPQYRRQGIAAAHTTAALQAAREAGATQAFLDASAGESVYTRLGFVALGTVTRCERAPDTD
jgi:GNAT superfamily N-acetyltransferase